MERAGGWRVLALRAVLAPWSWSGGLQVDGDRAEQSGFGIGGREGQTDARDGFDDAGPELEELEPEGGELGAGEVMGLGHRSRTVSISQ
jgi:hypothetical protein